TKSTAINKGNHAFGVHYDCDEDNNEWDSPKSEPSELASNFFSSALDDTSSHVHRWNQEDDIQRKVSFVLHEFYKKVAKAGDSNGKPIGTKLSRFNGEIAYANKCLMVSGKLQKTL